MTNLVLASLFLPLSHFLIASTRLRTLLVSWLGERPYSAGYSLLTVMAFAWLIAAGSHAPSWPLWNAPQWLRLAMTPMILLASFLITAGLTTPNPVIVRSEGLFNNPGVIRGILRVSRNPFFWGVGIFAVSHMIMIGDVAANLAFGSVAVLGLAGAPILDAKKARRHGDAWEGFAAATSDIPFLAIAQGRQRLVWAEIGGWRVLLSAVVFLAAFLFHRMLFGFDVVADFRVDRLL
jgi:uncharacterized membrane protein